MRVTHRRGDLFKMDSLNLKSLMEVVRTGSFSKASENLFVSQSAVSRRIKSLEEEYGCALVDRSGPTIEATGAGKLVITEAAKVLSIEENIVRRLGSLAGRPSLRYACTHPFGITWLPDVLRRYIAAHGDLSNLKLTMETPKKALQGLQEHEFDLIVIEHWEELDLADYVALSLPDDEMIFAAAPALGLGSPLVSLDELVKKRLFRRKEECCAWKYLSLSMQLAGRDASEFTQTVVVNDLHLIVQSLVDGDGVALISKDLVRGHLESGKLSEHRVEGFNHRRKRSLLRRRDAPPNPAVEFFVASIFAAFALELPELDPNASGWPDRKTAAAK
jgi:LysR family transcriptional regulator, transcriptional activator of the cysJI operon